MVLQDILDAWMQDADIFEKSQDPEEVLRRYFHAKMEHSFFRGKGSRAWDMEIIQGSPTIGKEIRKAAITWDKTVIRKIRSWIDEGRICAINPQSLINIIWSSTQHYAGYDHQIKVLNGNRRLPTEQRE